MIIVCDDNGNDDNSDDDDDSSVDDDDDDGVDDDGGGVGAIFTQDCFTRPLQKLLPTDTVAVVPTFLRCDIVMMMMMMMVTAYKVIIITITTVITVAVMTSCEKFTEWGRGNCTDVRIDSLNDWRINRCPRVVWTKEILFKISIKSTLVKCFFFIYL